MSGESSNAVFAFENPALNCLDDASAKLSQRTCSGDVSDEHVASWSRRPVPPIDLSSFNAVSDDDDEKSTTKQEAFL